MMPVGHRVVALSTWTIVASSTWTTAEVIAGGLIVVHMSAGRWSPDVDQYVKARRGDGRALRLMRRLSVRALNGHRGNTHRVELVALACLIAVLQASAHGLPWLGIAVAVAWGSHVLADAPFGRVPFLGRRVGAGLPSRGRVADVVTALFLVIGVMAVTLRLGVDSVNWPW